MRRIVLREEGEKVFPSLSGARVEREIPAPLHDAAARQKHARRGVQPVGFKCPDVGIDIARHRRDAAIAEPGEHFDLVAVFERELEFLVLGKGVHLFREDARRLFIVPRKKGKRLFHCPGICSGVDKVRARRAASSEMIFQTWLCGFSPDGNRTGADMIDPGGDIHDLLGGDAPHERTEIASVPPLHLARDADVRIFLPRIHLDIGIGLVVL